jgi:transcriptional regulator with XRE-family HTH domain
MPDLLEPTSSLRQLAESLRELRTEAGLDQSSLAMRLKVAQPQISRVETARRIPSTELVTAWATTCGEMLGRQVDQLELVRLREEATSVRISWRRVHERGVARDQESYGELERRATGIRVFQSSVIPGQLQVGAYARRLLEIGTDKSAEEIAEAVQARLERQLILHNPPPDGCRFVITEAALRWRPVGTGSARVQVSQLDRLLAVLDLSGVDLRVIPWDDPQPATHRHPFVYLALPGDDGEAEQPGLVIVETVDGEDIIRSSEKLALYRDRFDLLASSARTGAAAREVILRVSHDLRGLAD